MLPQGHQLGVRSSGTFKTWGLVGGPQVIGGAPTPSSFLFSLPGHEVKSFALTCPQPKAMSPRLSWRKTSNPTS
jgi:hypothetical protein